MLAQEHRLLVGDSNPEPADQESGRGVLVREADEL